MHRLQLSTAGECVSSSLRPAFHEYIFSAFPTCAPPPVESIIGVGFRVPLCFVLMLRESVASRTERAPIAGRMAPAESQDEKSLMRGYGTEISFLQNQRPKGHVT